MILTPPSVDATLSPLSAGRYVATRELAVAVFLALKLQRPVLLEDEAGVGKTKGAKTLCEALGRDLIGLQCHQGLDVSGSMRAAAKRLTRYCREVLWLNPLLRYPDYAPPARGKPTRAAARTP